MRPLIALAVLLALLGHVSAADATLGDNGLTTYTGRRREPNTLVFGNDMVTEQALQATLNFAKDVLKGTWRPVRNDPPTEQQEVHLECLNSVAPAPLNWEMWCPGKDAKVVGWQDKSGAAHRQITLRPQAGMTSTMYQWFITTTVLGLMPPVVEFQGNHYHYYHLWHPLDHVESTWSMGPKVPILQKGFPVYVLIHERYRNPANFTYDRHYETNGWFYVEDAAANLMKNRYVITMPYMGIPTWTMILEFNDTPEGLVVGVEVIAGVPHKGYDDRAPKDGYRMAAGMNELFTAPLLARQRGSFDWDESINAITRHVIEEFSNLQHFVPYLYEKCTLLGKAGLNWVPTLGSWLQNNNRTVADSTSISFYHTLEKLAAKQINRNGTIYAKIVDAKIDLLNKTVMAAQKALTKANEGVSRKTFVPISNRLTQLSFNLNKAHGAHPEADVTIASKRRNVWDKLMNASQVTTETMVITGGLAGKFKQVNISSVPEQNQELEQPAKGDSEQDGGEGDDDGDEDADKPAAKPAPKPAPKPAAKAANGTRDPNAQRQPVSTTAPDATPVKAPTQPKAKAQPKPQPQPKPDATNKDASDDDNSDEDDDDDDDADGDNNADGLGSNEALKLREDLSKAAWEPARDSDDESDDLFGPIGVDAAEDDDGATEAKQMSAQVAAAYMDAPHVTGGLHSDEAAIEEHGISMADVQATISALENKNVSGMIASIKQDVMAGLENQTITFHGSNNTLRMPESVLDAMAAKHALHKGVLGALLNKTDIGLGLGTNFSVWTMPDPSATTAYPGGDSESNAGNAVGSETPMHDNLLADLALKHALVKGGALTALLSNGSLNGSVSIRPVPHSVFTLLANHTQGQAASGHVIVNVTSPVTKPGLKGSLQRLGQSVSRAKRLAKSFRPALSLGRRNQTMGGRHDKDLKLQLKFWDQRRV